MRIGGDKPWTQRARSEDGRIDIRAPYDREIYSFEHLALALGVPRREVYEGLLAWAKRTGRDVMGLAGDRQHPPPDALVIALAEGGGTKSSDDE